MRAEIHCPGQTPYVGKINSRLRVLRPAGVPADGQGLTGLDINYLITVDFRGFIQIVDRLGGAWIDVDRRYFNDHSGPYRLRDDRPPARLPAA